MKMKSAQIQAILILMFKRRILEQSQPPEKFKMEELRYARSHMELIAARQRWIQIALTATNVLIGCLVALKVFGLI